ncbi:putative 2-succinyl-6-hydroxy-2,4-cyclohexadiene-1-carboxylate synthase [Marivirga lumbricoides]|uniref:2-succinyl-6-hydroxy-2,4-cyclohexadiene-1-carboxylate synthase n=1 Tax=Marivirga lumbricoides TaxID=1046115 RepID=A0ABQ1MEU5_9BACT|nr:putative 2-succinyl-6-hydroxy-2,4-cyclohexadiene-1-carboxylate synthase [Marivirga lumbricoides]
MEKLLILHGALGSKSQFEALLSSFSQKVDAYFLEFSGHGIQPFQKDFSIEQFSVELIRFVDNNNLKGCHVFGYSMGGYVALYTASNYPDYFQSIQTLGTKFLWSPEIAEKETKMLNAEKIIEKVPAFAEDLERRHNDWQKLLICTKSLMEGLGNEALLRGDELKAVNIPVKISRGSKDHMVSAEESIWAKNHLQLAEYHEIYEMKHPIEKYDKVALAKTIEKSLAIYNTQ